MPVFNSRKNTDRQSWFPFVKSALDNHTMLAVFGVDGKIIHVNDKLCETSGFDKNELIGESYRLMASGNHPKTFFESISDTIQGGNTWRGEIENKTKNGTNYWIDCTVYPFTDASQNIAGFIVIETDISDYKNIEASLRFSFNLLKSTFENFPGGISYVSKDLILESANNLFYEVLDLPKDLLPQGCKYEDVIRYNAERGDYGEGDVEAMVAERIALAEKFEKHSFERKRPDGSCLEIRGFPLPEGGFVTTYVDVTERKKAESTNKRLARIVEGAFNEVYVFDANTLKFLQVNDSACKNLGYTIEEMRELTPLDLKPEFTLEDFEETIAPLRSGDKDHLRFETLHRRKDETFYSVQITLQLISRDDRAVFAAIIEDITEKQRHELQIAHMAHHDSLTDLPNRTLLHIRLEEAISQIGHTGQFAVLCLDLDRFKTINDTFGHAVGDRMLKITAQRLQSCVGICDTVARLGGDEFAVIQNLTKDSDDATVLAKRISEIISQPINVDGRNLVVNTSIGIAIATGEEANPDQLLHHADLAMYRAKDDGRGTYHFFEPKLDIVMQERRKLEIDLMKGLENDEFEVMYQPVLNLENDNIVSFEALLRWHHPEHGMIAPTEFISIAEECGFIHLLGKWVLQRACIDAANWPEDIRVAVNLSPAQFKGQNLALHVTSVLAETDFPASRLEFEITESVLMQETEQVFQTLHQLRKLGVQISMDDFGTGYSSLSYLRRFPFDKIKIDRSFIMDLSSNSDSIAFIQVITSLGNKLGISILAEGVETFEQKAIVRAEGCAEMQGFFFSPPRSFDDVMQQFFPSQKQQQSIA